MGSKGNKRQQNRRKYLRLKFDERKPPKQKVLYQCIDGNMSYYPKAFCLFHNGYLTEGLICTHNCRKRRCKRLRWLNFDAKGIPTVDYFRQSHEEDT